MLLSGGAPDYETLLNALNRENIYQKTIIITLLFRQLCNEENTFLKHVLESNSRISSYLLSLFQHDSYYDSLGVSHCVDEKLIKLLICIFRQMSIGSEQFIYALAHIMSSDADPVFIGLFLIGIYTNELSPNDGNYLTLAMRDTGTIYDYRRRFQDKKIIRRYPTGAVSEKTALLLPSMIADSSREYPVVSSFLVAKSLSFTGGTWDKLGSIPGFVFPLPGNNTCDVIGRCGVAMTVAQADLCPVDTILYQLRSITDTVDSVSLAASSIASKQLSCPPDLLLLDVRYGEGAFFNKDDAYTLLDSIKGILLRNGIDVISQLTQTDQPNGSSIGNQLELCEAISIMCKRDDCFDIRAKEEQIALVSTFYATIMEYVLPIKPYSEWCNLSNKMISEQKLIKSFMYMLEAHGVSASVIEELINDPFKFFRLVPHISIKAESSGCLTKINQKQLGNIVNFGVHRKINVDLSKPVQDILSYGSQPFRQEINLLLCKRLGDEIHIGDTLCQLFAERDSKMTYDLYTQLSKQIQQCFNIE